MNDFMCFEEIVVENTNGDVEIICDEEYYDPVTQRFFVFDKNGERRYEY